MDSRIDCSGLSVARQLYDLVNNEIAPAAGIDPAQFWAGYARILEDMAPFNRFLLEKRERMHGQINAFCHENPGTPDLARYKKFLLEIGYLVPEGGDFQIKTSNVDPEMAEIAGPQLVVPVMNARFTAHHRVAWPAWASPP